MEVLTQSVGDPRLHAVWKDVWDPVFVLRLDEDDDPNAPQSVNRHLNVRRRYDAFLLRTSIRFFYFKAFVRVTHLFKADVCDVPQDAFHHVSPLPLAQRILLSPDDVKVMRDVIGGVVLCPPLALTLKPRADVVGRTGISCRFIKNIWLRCYFIYQEIKIHSKCVRRQRCYPCSRCPQTLWSCPVQAFHCVCSSFAEVVGRIPPFSGETVQKSQNEGI